MRKLVVFLVAGILVLALAMYTLSYTVRFTEVAVKTRFGQAGDNAIKTEPGLYFKLPYPFESVTKYDTRQRLVQARQESQQTRDDRQVVVEAFCTYRVTNPKQFFSRFSSAGDRAEDHFEQAEEQVLQSALRSSMAETSKYRLDELFTTDPDASRIAELESRILDEMRDAGSLEADYGVLVTQVGISGINFPEATTEQVFNRMIAERDRLAQEISASGQAEAQEIEARAESEAETILSFVRQIAAEREARGQREAAQYLAQMSEDKELATFLRAIEAMEKAMSKRTTLILGAEWPGIGVFEPDAIGTSEAEIPTFGLTEEPGGE